MTGGIESDDLRRAFAARKRSAGDEGCPPPERLWSAARGELPPEEGRALVAHTVTCAACAEAWRVARDLGPSPAPRPVEARGARAWWGVLAAAAILALAIVGPRLWRGERPADPAYRAGLAPPIRALVPEDRPLPRDAFLLRWTPGPANTRYTVRVTTEDLTPVAEATNLEEARFTVPAQVLASLPAGTKIVWQVQAMVPGGAVVSGTFVSRLE